MVFPCIVFSTLFVSAAYIVFPNVARTTVHFSSVVGKTLAAPPMSRKDAHLSSSDHQPETFLWHLLMKLLLKRPLFLWAFFLVHLFLTLQSIVYFFNFLLLLPLS